MFKLIVSATILAATIPTLQSVRAGDIANVFDGAAQIELPDGYHREDGRSDDIDTFFLEGAEERLSLQLPNSRGKDLKAGIQVLPQAPSTSGEAYMRAAEEQMRRNRKSGQRREIAGGRIDPQTGMTHVVYAGFFFGYFICKPTDRGDVCVVGQDDARLKTMKPDDWPTPDQLATAPLEDIVRLFEGPGNAVDAEAVLSSFRWR